MLDAVQGSSLRSAHARAARGLRALTAPARSSSDSNCVMAHHVRFERTLDDSCVRKSPAGAFIGLQDTPSAPAQPPRTEHLSIDSGPSRTRSRVANLPVDLFTLVAVKRSAHDLRSALHAGLRPASVPELSHSLSVF